MSPNCIYSSVSRYVKRFFATGLHTYLFDPKLRQSHVHKPLWNLWQLNLMLHEWRGNWVSQHDSLMGVSTEGLLPQGQCQHRKAVENLLVFPQTQHWKSIHSPRDMTAHSSLSEILCVAHGMSFFSQFKTYKRDNNWDYRTNSANLRQFLGFSYFQYPGQLEISCV